MAKGGEAVNERGEFLKNMLKKFTPLVAVLSLGISAFAEDTPMEKEMGTMNKAYKALKKSIEDPAQKAF